MEKLHPLHRFLILVVWIGISGCNSKAQQSQTSAMKEVVAIQFEKWKKGKANFFDLLAEEMVWTVSGNSPVSGTYRGKTAFMEQAVAPIMEKLKTPLKPELISLTEDGEFVWLHFKAKATGTNNKVYENKYVWKMQLKNSKIISCVAFLDTYALTQLMTEKETSMQATMEETQAYIGMWVTADGFIRHELLPNNRYDEARGDRESAYQGSYKVIGNHIDYKDDTGFTADGEFKEGVLYHAGMVLYKENK